jgi:hypothetical protein
VDAVTRYGAASKHNDSENLDGGAPARLSRRSLLARSVLGGGLLAAGGAAAAGTATAAPGTANDGDAAAAGYGKSTPSSGATAFFKDPTLNLQTLFALGSVGYGIAEVGEVLATVERVRAKGSSYQAFYDEFLALGRELASQADGAARRGRRVTARSKYLRSAEYYSQALYFVLGTREPTRGRERAVYRAMQRSWDRASRLFSPSFQRISIPYGTITLPGYLLRPDTSGRPRPTVILNNGSDAQNVDLYAFGGAAALERGYNALIFEGPGQGSLLFERNLPFVPDWERVVSPVVDVLSRRRDVDRRRIAIVGWSFCGDSVARAAAYEHRLAAVVLDPGVNSIIAPYNLGKLTNLIDAGQRQEVDAIWAGFLARSPASVRFTIAKRSEVFAQPDFYDQARYMQQFTLDASTIGAITSPTLVMQAQDEQFYPGQSRQVYDQLRARRKLQLFTAAQGAQYHDEPMAPQARNEALYDWLDATLKI